AKLRAAPQWTQPPSTLSAAAGMHRFVWPLRHAAPAPLAEGDVWADGPWASPGEYRLVLTVDGKSLEQPLQVLPDPRATLRPGCRERAWRGRRPRPGTCPRPAGGCTGPASRRSSRRRQARHIRGSEPSHAGRAAASATLPRDVHPQGPPDVPLDVLPAAPHA